MLKALSVPQKPLAFIRKESIGVVVGAVV